MSLWCPAAAVGSQEELPSGYAAGAWSQERERAVLRSARFPFSSYLLVSGCFESRCRDAVGSLRNSRWLFPGAFVAPKDVCKATWFLLAQMHLGDPRKHP